MGLASAEMTKHAINAWLANSVVFINEISNICEVVGADAKEVELGMKSEERIGKKAYLSPGSAFSGGTLARDLNYLNEFKDSSYWSSIIKSNNNHKSWIKNNQWTSFK